jgi:oxygen-independent coproporphyrinogen-3 oxidase
VLRNLPRTVKAIEKESLEWKERLELGPLKSLYMGGGTPSLLSEDELIKVTKPFQNLLTNESEVTLEANPDDVNPEKVRKWRSAGFNRVSLGIQSFHDKELRWMNRSHSSQQGREAVEILRNEGIENISIDLIYGIPVSNIDRWRETLSLALGLQPNHISAYILTIEERTAFGHAQKKGLLKEVSDEDVQEQYLWLCNTLRSQGFDHYELSNFARSTHQAQHNSSYWKGVSFLGIGPSAHSFDGSKRWKNIANNTIYCSSIEGGKADWFEEESLSVASQRNERILTGLRTWAGIDRDTLFATEEGEEIKKRVLQFEKAQWLTPTPTGWRIPEENWLLSDHIIAELMVV